MLKEKRSTRGQRMNELIGEAAEEEESFWNHETWAEEDEDSSGAESFSEEEVKPDVFDDDFNDTESSSDEDDSEEDNVRTGRDRWHGLRGAAQGAWWAHTAQIHSKGQTYRIVLIRY